MSALRILLITLVACSALVFGNSSQAQESEFDPNSFMLSTELFVDGLTSPVHMVDPDDGTGRMFVVQQTGLIVIVQDGSILTDPFLDISDQVSGSSEQGLLSMALHPDFAENGTFFIDYTDINGDSQIERWRIDQENPDRADPGSAETILTVDQPYANHNGGLLMFGPDGSLYVGLGDGGSQGDPHGNGQNLDALLGKILRIDVDSPEDDRPYGIPDDNPFVDRDGARGEVWAYGLRNPWRFSFDRETGDLLIADVGGGAYEEANLAPAGQSGQNFGWNIMEGPACYSSTECDQSGIALPFFWYETHEYGCSIVSGYVYRGEAIPDLRGAYLVGDYCSGLVWAIAIAEDGPATPSQPVETGLNISSFAEDASGELYLVDLNGAIYKIVPSEG